MQQLLMAGTALQVGTQFGKRSLQRAAAGDVGRQSELEAQQEELGAVQREADRKQRLVSALASQIASAGTKNISAFEGSPLTILEADIEKEETATERDIFQTKLAALTKRTQGRLKRSMLRSGADIELAGGLVSTGFQATQVASVLGGKE